LFLSRAGLGIALVGLLFSTPRRWKSWIAIAASMLLMLTLSLGSHAAAEPQPLWPVLADWVHLIAASIWVGGLIQFVVGLWSAYRLDVEPRSRFVSRLIPHFSNLALASVALLTVTGVYFVILRVGSWNALVASLYGRALIIKLLLALPMLVMGAFNLLVTTPKLKRKAGQPGGSPRDVEQFKRRLRAEALLGLILLLWVGFFTSLPPAQTSSLPPGISAARQVDDLRVSINIDPARVGINTFKVRISANGKPPTGVQLVNLQFSSNRGLVPPSKAQMAAIGDGNYTLQGSYLSLTDQWEVTIVVVRSGRFDAYAPFQVDLNPGGAMPIPWNRASAMVLLASAGALVAAVLSIALNQRRKWVTGLIPALLLVGLSGLVFFRSPEISQNDPANPVVPSEKSAMAGHLLYQEKCLPCHGPAGKGDGPTGLTLNPRPADLSLHAVPGVHTDGQLFLWITDGYPNSAMPGYRQSLTDEQRWNLVNFIRTLAPK
ncbi:MAG: CopD family protein, partial [Anaerolineaceae bacterium]|nr:CopD family protein [Anaerolineaceae bacterium]